MTGRGTERAKKQEGRSKVRIGERQKLGMGGGRGSEIQMGGKRSVLMRGTKIDTHMS